MLLILLAISAAAQPADTARWQAFDRNEYGPTLFDSRSVDRNGMQVRVQIRYAQANGDPVGELIDLDCRQRRSRTIATVIVLEGQPRVLRSSRARFEPIGDDSRHAALAARLCPAADARRPHGDPGPAQ